MSMTKLSQYKAKSRDTRNLKLSLLSLEDEGIEYWRNNIVEICIGIDADDQYNCRQKIFI